MASSLGVMQPYFFPYIGYYQLIFASDIFLIYDDVQYSRGGWINRNRIASQENVQYITLPVSRNSHTKLIKDSFFTSSHLQAKEKIVRILYQTYNKAPEFAKQFPLLEKLILDKEISVATYLSKQIISISELLKIKTQISRSSFLPRESSKPQDKTQKLCELASQLKTTEYINSPGGMILYNKEDFLKYGITLKFINPQPFVYGNNQAALFESNLSIIDALMFCPLKLILNQLSRFTLS